MTRYTYTSDCLTRPSLGLIVLQTDETIEADFREMTGAGVPIYVSRVASGAHVTSETLQHMSEHLTGAAQLLPEAPKYGCVGYGCTSGTAQIGPENIARLIRNGMSAPRVTEPLSALVAACKALDLKEIAFLSPYVASVSATLRGSLANQGIATPVFGGFDEDEEAKVVRIDAASIQSAACDLVRGTDVQGIFLSCTNLRTMTSIEPLEASLRMPVLSSNQVLAWHMGQLAGVAMSGPGRLFQAQS